LRPGAERFSSGNKKLLETKPMPTPQEQFDRMANQLPIARDATAVRKRLEAMEKLLEGMFTSPAPTAGSGWT
jgi:hypothetical protein